MKNNKFFAGVLSGIACTLLIISVVIGIYTQLGASKDGIELLTPSETKEEESSDAKKDLTDKRINYDKVDEKLSVLEQYIDSYYLEDFTAENLESGIYKGALAGLEDPYSVYYTSDEYKQLMESNQGVYCGIGAYVGQDVKTGVITISKPFENGPAYEAGIRPGDILYEVDGEEVTGKDLTEVVAKMKGKEGTKVEVKVVREGESEPLPFTVTRRKIEVPTISYEMLENKIGYISVTEFDKVTATQFREAIDELNKQEMNGLIIDLRNNPGGLLTTVVDMLDRIVDKGMLVYTKDKNGEGDEYKAKDNDSLEIPMSVLINGNSASASEVFTGALQDYNLATVVGTTSFGKGIVQNVFPLKDGSAIKLTISKYYTPNGRNIHGTGIEPDLKVELDDSVKNQVTIEKDKDNQLQKAIDVVKEKMTACAVE